MNNNVFSPYNNGTEYGKFNAVNLPYGNCLIPSNQFQRNFPTSETYGQTNPCIDTLNVNIAPSIYPTPTLKQIAQKNSENVNKLDTQFFNNVNYPQAAKTFLSIDNFTNTTLQDPRRPEVYKNSYINFAADTLHVSPDVIMSVFFSDDNIEHLRSTIVSKVKEITSQSGVAGSAEGVTIMKPNMDDFFNYMISTYQNYKVYNGSICFVNSLNNSNIKTEISKLNSNILQDYISKMVSQINMYIYYYKDASQLPEQLSVPLNTTMKGSKTLEYNVGFSSGNSNGISSYNEVGNIM
jgi:hypothetical protein